MELPRLGAVPGLEGEVDDALAPGIGRRLDGRANTDLDPGLILSLSPFLQDPAAREVLRSWGPGFFDPRWSQDGISDPVSIPPAHGLDGVAAETYTGEGRVSCRAPGASRPWSATATPAWTSPSRTGSFRSSWST